MKKKDLSSLKLTKRTISDLNTRITGGTIVITTTIVYSYLQCDDIAHTSNDHDGKKCDVWSIGHDDGSICASDKWGGDWCNGR